MWTRFTTKQDHSRVLLSVSRKRGFAMKKENKTSTTKCHAISEWVRENFFHVCQLHPFTICTPSKGILKIDVSLRPGRLDVGVRDPPTFNLSRPHQWSPSCVTTTTIYSCCLILLLSSALSRIGRRGTTLSVVRQSKPDWCSSGFQHDLEGCVLRHKWWK